MKTPSKWPVSTFRISIALLPQPIIWPVPIYATDVGISPHCSTMFLDNCAIKMKEKRNKKIIRRWKWNITLSVVRSLHLSVRVHVHSFVIVAQQQLHSIRIWQRDDTVRRNRALSLWWENKIRRIDGTKFRYSTTLRLKNIVTGNSHFLVSIYRIRRLDPNQQREILRPNRRSLLIANLLRRLDQREAVGK